jgi:hypothetical protein
MAVQYVASAYQESAGLEMLADEYWKKLLQLIKSNRDITPHQLSPTKLYEQQFNLTLYIYLPR